MEKHYKSGSPGELAAIHYLREKDWIILDTNWRFKRAEIDIIAREADILVFIEVKSRTRTRMPPELAVTPRQEDRITDAAREYLLLNNWQGEYRFDIIAVVIFDQVAVQITHFKDAFFPGHH